MTTSSASPAITTAHFVLAARRNWLLVVTVVLLCAGAAVAIAFMTPKVYQGQTVIVVESVEDSSGTFGGLASRVGGLAQLAGVSLSGSQSRGEMIALLQSYALAERVVTRYKLAETLLPVESGDPPPTVWRAATTFSSGVIDVTENRLTGVITVTAEWTDATLAAKWANLLVSEANQLARERATAEATASLEYLRKEIDSTERVELRQMLFRLVEGQVSKQMLATVRPDYAFRIIDQAVPPERSVRPRKLLILAAGVILGGILSFLIVAFRVFRFNGPESTGKV